MSSFDVPTSFSTKLHGSLTNNKLKEWTDALNITPTNKRRVLKADYLAALQQFYCGHSEQSPASSKGKMNMYLDFGLSLISHYT